MLFNLFSHIKQIKKKKNYIRFEQYADIIECDETVKIQKCNI